MQKFYKQGKQKKKNSSKVSSFIGQQETMDTMGNEFKINLINSREVNSGRKEKKYHDIEKLINKIMVPPNKGKVLKS
eukprot:CAMPEP_0170548854 /NCGR_PEP_ID=MMETSP0211-20121228/7032_1 /TAXON_ID=311385 /ORGANISM="Pseudokeronopsis sp., Strain OXSARD2" /LENGTH=76 /DNA_ID=CAMNT_0010854521 /DNA_START=423 /DNA_END=653 /DNA_ORIENTATION=+